MLATAEIKLRTLKDTDLDFLFSLENDKSLWAVSGTTESFSLVQLANYISHAKQDIATAGQFRFVIDLENTPIGFIDLFDYTVNSAGVGVIIAKNYRRRGFSKEALELLIDYATNTLKIEKLHCNIQKDNLASIKLFTSCGFELEREEKELQYFVKLAKK